MKKPSDREQRREDLRQSIIGLGEKSIRKSYYPELKQQIKELEQTNKKLQEEIIQRHAAQDQANTLAEQLRQAQKMEAIGTLAGGIAHDFNNILSAILGFTELAQLHINTSCQQSCPAKDDLDKVLQAGHRAKDLVRQILTFSRRQDENRVPISLVTVVEEALSLLRSTLPSSISIRTRFAPGKYVIEANETQLHQVVVNLANNSAQAMGGHGGTLTVEIEPTTIDEFDRKAQNLELAPGPYLLLRISDTGCGMPRRIAERIFEPYFTTKPKGQGTGMGLAVVHGIVTSHGGSISVYSEEGKGTTFQIHLPELRERRPGQKTTISHPVQGGKEKILVVDDEILLAELHGRLLEGLGYDVHVETIPEDALHLFTSDPHQFDLVVTDMTMPGLNGAELAKGILAQRPDLPIILCTGFSDLVNEEKARSLGVRDFAMKPLVRHQIAQLVRKLLDARE